MNSTAYHPVPGKYDGTTTTTRVASSPGVFRPKPGKRHTGGLTLHIIGHIIGFLWLAPIAALLVLNFKRHVIGASVWCPSGKCDSKALDPNAAIKRAEELDRQDHDVLGALQYVAKALEVWFMFVATGLVYDIALLFAKRWGGLPIGYLFTHLEFGDIRNLANPTLWTSPIPHGNSPRKTSVYRLYLFAGFVAFLTVLTNFMGPATAVLVLPTLQWVDTDKVPVQRYTANGASSPPRGDTVLPGCTDAQLLNRDYTCTSEVYGPSLDTFVASAASSIQQGMLPWGYPSIKAASLEGLVTFQANISANGAELVWVPLRQALRDLSLDVIDLQQVVAGQSDKDSSTATQPVQKQPKYNNSLETVLQREGPSIGVQAGCYVGNYSEHYIADHKIIMCYDNWSVDNISNYTRCIRAGTGWSPVNTEAQFNLGDGKDYNSETTVFVYFSDKSAFYNASTDFDTGLKDCLAVNSTTCDYDKLFTTPPALPQDLRNATVNVQVQEYYTPITDTRFWCDSIAYSSFPVYSVDTLETVNPMGLVQLHNLPNASFFTPLVVHPDWWLAAWSVPQEGTVDRNRTVGRNYAQKLRAFFDSAFSWDNIDADQEEAIFDHIYSIAQSISLISYEVDNSSAALNAPPQPDQPVFHRYATLRVWAYGLSDRTSKLGVTVTLLGCLCVLLRVALASALKIRHEHSTVELFVAALEHNHHGEFDGIEDEALLARVRYFVDEDERRQRPTFISEKWRTSSGTSMPQTQHEMQAGAMSPPEFGHTRSY